ncbi:MAG: hypothetical protein R8L53_09940 [Mariprofundales bacterium]
MTADGIVIEHKKQLANRWSKLMRHLFSLCFLFIILGRLNGCGNKFENDIQPRYEKVTTTIQTLKAKIEAKELSNVKIIISYASQLKQQNPTLSSAADTLALEATIKGAMYQSLLQRLQVVNPKPENKHQYIPSLQELESLQAASDPLVYNDSLQDIVNTLADLSGGSLARINVPTRHNAQTGAGASSASAPGQYLVGNPTYGQWASNSSGQSFWQWYGQYRFFSDIAYFAFGRNQRQYYEYNYWHSRPHYSYYHDYGRRAYGSTSDKRSWQSGRRSLASQGIQPPAAKSYASAASQKRVSTYASRQSSLASNLRAGQLPANNSSKITSQSRGSSASKRTSSFFGSSSSSSSRSGSSSRSSRGVRGGK